jgi:ABC-2 type transport system ATP-binding protein
MKLRVEDLSKSYKSSNGVVESCKKINFEACDGEIIGLLGANGAGKTTLIKMICNLVNPTSGSIYLDGKDMSHNKRIAQKKIGVVLEGARNIYNFLTVQENIEYFSFLNGFSKKETAEKANQLFELFELEEKRHTTVNELSRGMQQKVAIMIALIKNPDILILDEPTLGLDIVGQIRMRDAILQLAKEKNRLVLICTHDIALVKAICTRVLCFRQGRLVKDVTLVSSGFLDLESEEMVVHLQNCPEVRDTVNKHQFEILSEDHDVIEIVTKFHFEDLLKDIDSSRIILMERRNSNLEEYLREIEEKRA